MHKPRTTYHRLTNWLLVLVIAFAPLQGAFSAFNDTCEHESRTAVTDTDNHTTIDDLTGHEHPGSSTGAAHDCCSQGCNSSGCASACNMAHAAPFLLLSNLIPFNDSYNIYEPQFMTLRIGRAVPTLLRPPRTSV